MRLRAIATSADKPADHLAERKLPFGAEFRVVRGAGPSRKVLRALLAELSPQGAAIVLPVDCDGPAPGEQIGLTVTAAGCRLFDIVAEVTAARCDHEGPYRA